MRKNVVSILVPLFNEEQFIAEVLSRVMAAPLPEGFSPEILVVDDSSTDDSAVIAENIAAMSPGVVRVIRLARNRGKGNAIRTAIEHATGEFCIIQDSDLEYNPQDYPRLLGPLVDGVADVVYGSRFASTERRRVLYYWHSIANYLLTTLCNVFADVNLTDMETGYKAFRTSLLKSIPIRSERFGIEPELTIKLAKRQARFYEVPISYEGRTYEDGKKIGLKDAFQAVAVILKNWVTSDLYKDPGEEILDAFSVAPRFNRWMAETIRPYVGHRIMEIGAGMGNLTRQFVGQCDSYVATDVNVNHLARLCTRLQHQPRLVVATCDLSKRQDFQPFIEAADTVICLNVLEHMEDDLECARNMFSALQPGGRALILVPHGQSIYGRLDVVLGHYRRYSHEQLRAVLEGAGFSVERILDFNRVSRPGWFIKGKLLQQSRIARSQIKVFDRFVGLWQKIDKYLPWHPTSIIAVAVKPLRKTHAIDEVLISERAS
jgi:glycosyltransferase involved in cell wall biosynthesis